MLRNPFVRVLPLYAWCVIALSTGFSARGELDGELEVTNSVPAVTNNVEADTQTLRSFLILQEQLRQTQHEIAQARTEAEEAAKRTSDILAARLNLIEQTLTVQRQREFDVLQRSTQWMLFALGGAALLGFGVLLATSWMQLRTVSRLAEFSKQWQLAPALPPAPSYAQLTNGEAPTLSPREPMDPAAPTLVATIDRLQQRVDELEQSAPAATSLGTDRPRKDAAPSAVPTHLAKGQALLNLDKPAEALACFDEALAVEPKNVEAWIKKGTALERLQRIDEAVAAYDGAIAADGSTATGYLFKAGAYNRQKKYAEALQCYEKALGAQKTRAVSGGFAGG